jgi:tRNA(adenine34) deaminase
MWCNVVLSNTFARDEAEDDRDFMALALETAQKAGESGEIPVGAVVVLAGEIISAKGNECERLDDPTTHAEILALQEAAARVGGRRLSDATLYVTLEPCSMCAGAIVLARIKRLVYGADDPKAGAAGSILNVVDHPALNHHPEVRAGLMEAEASALLKEFFADLRSRKGG